MSPIPEVEQVKKNSASPSGEKRHFFHRFGDFWQRITEGLQMEDLWSQFAQDARAGYGLYSREVDWEAVRNASRWKQPFHAVKALFWALLLKLSPARRVLLVIALVLLFLSGLSFDSASEGRGHSGFNGALAAALILFVLLSLELADRVIMKRDLQIAREIQSWLVPSEPPSVPGIQIAFATRPANTVSGDYYDAFWRGGMPIAGEEAQTSPGRRLFLAVADVAGKSVPAALLMATLQASLHSLAEVPSTLEELVGRLDQYVCAHSAEGRRFTTAFLAELNTVTQELRYVNAGHNAPILRRSSGTIERLDLGGLPLGVDPSRGHETGTVQLQPGDLLFVFTDGVVEAVNEAGEEFAEPRLLELVQSALPSSATNLRDRAMAAVEAYVGGARQHDDITCLILFIPPGAA